MSEIDWGVIFHGDRRPVLGNGEPDPKGYLKEIDLLVNEYQAAYPDKARREWIERRLRKWWEGREG